MRNKGDKVRVLYTHRACNAASRVEFTLTGAGRFVDPQGVEHEAAVSGAALPTWPCPTCGARLRGREVQGRVTDAKCGAKCRNSKGPTCDCACGGENHGAGHGC